MVLFNIVALKTVTVWFNEIDNDFYRNSKIFDTFGILEIASATAVETINKANHITRVLPTCDKGKLLINPSFRI